MHELLFMVVFNSTSVTLNVLCILGHTRGKNLWPQNSAASRENPATLATSRTTSSALLLPVYGNLKRSGSNVQVMYKGNEFAPMHRRNIALQTRPQRSTSTTVYKTTYRSCQKQTVARAKLMLPRAGETGIAPCARCWVRNLE